MEPGVGGGDVRAVLMVGGRGVRLRPFTTTIPKPLVPIGGECPILEVLLRQLRRYRIKDVTLAIGHMGHLIRSYVGDGSAWGLRVDYWEDGAPLGTVGPLVEHVQELPEHVLVMNGDLLCSLDFNALIAFHLEHGGELTLAASRRDLNIDFGVLDLDGADLLAFREKPRLEYHVNMGIYVVARAALERYEPGHAVGADDFIGQQLSTGRSPKVFKFDGYWLDIGRPEDYDKANAEFERLRPVLFGDDLANVIDLRSDAAPLPYASPVTAGATS